MGDLLMSYDGVDVTYDTIGNPNSLNGRSYVWEHGRELRKVTYGGTEWTNTYDVNGLRAKREGGGKTYSYIYNGSQLSRMTVTTSAGTNTFTFSYDASGTPVSVIQNGTTYYYATNLQGDVVALLNASGTAVVTYTYDAWGKLLSTGGTMATTLGVLNPLRYRGYIYDTETGLYYLQSRYYDPEVGRFINADGLVATGVGLLGNNMFAYCNNNPSNFKDTGGYLPISSGIVSPQISRCYFITMDLLNTNIIKTLFLHPLRSTKDFMPMILLLFLAFLIIWELGATYGLDLTWSIF